MVRGAFPNYPLPPSHHITWFTLWSAICSLNFHSVVKAQQLCEPQTGGWKQKLCWHNSLHQFELELRLKLQFQLELRHRDTFLHPAGSKQHNKKGAVLIVQRRKMSLEECNQCNKRGCLRTCSRCGERAILLTFSLFAHGWLYGWL